VSSAVASELSAADVEATDKSSVWKSGLSYRGVFHDESIRLHLGGVRRERGDLSGLLRVDHSGRCLYTGKFNLASVSSRSSLARYLKDRDGGYDGWTVVLEELCRHVIAIEAEGPETVVLGGRQAVRIAPAYRLRPFMPRDAATWLYGPGGASKSTLAGGIAVSVQSGIPLLPGWDVEQANVLILDYEATRDEWEDRIVGIAAGMGISTPEVRYRRCARRLVDLAESVAVQVADDNIGLLVIDSVGLAEGSSSDGGDANEATLRMFDAFRAIGTTVLAIDHVTGDNVSNERTGARPYKSIYKVNLARSALELRREEQQAHPEAFELSLSQRKVNSGPLQKPMGIRVSHGPNAIVIGPCEITAPDLEQHAGATHDRMRRQLRSGAMEEAELAETLGLTRSAVRKTIARHNGFVRNPDGKIGLVVL
jgi:hypothetical protein